VSGGATRDETVEAVGEVDLRVEAEVARGPVGGGEATFDRGNVAVGPNSTSSCDSIACEPAARASSTSDVSTPVATL